MSIVVPGMTSSSVMMALGLYQPMLEGLADLNLLVLSASLPGMGLAILLLARFMSWLFRTHYSIAFHGILGIVLASTVVILPPVKLLISPGYTFAMGLGDWLIYAGCFAAGAVLAWALGKVQGKE